MHVEGQTDHSHSGPQREQHCRANGRPDAAARRRGAELERIGQRVAVRSGAAAGCSQLLPLGTLESILGFGILGQVNYLKAAPVPQSGRTGRVTCTYGTAPGAAAPTAPTVPTPTPSKGAKPTTGPKPTASAPAPLVQVSYITYTDASTAAGRVQTTIEADGATATVSNVSVSGKPAYILIGATSSELVMSDLARTIVVELSPALVTSDKAPAALEGIAAAMLRFGAPVSSSGSPSAGAPSAGGSA